MRKKNTLKILLITLMSLLLATINVYADARALIGAYGAAEEGLPALLEASDWLEKESRSEIKADQESAFQVFTINPQALTASDVRDTDIEATPLYCFLVKQGEDVVGLATVEEIDGEWKILTFGGAEMAAEVKQIFDAYPTEEGYTTRYLRSYQSFSDYFEIYHDGHLQGIVPLTSGRMAMELENTTFNPKDLIDRDRAFINVGKKVNENLEAYGHH